MRASVYHGKGDMRVDSVADSAIRQPDRRDRAHHARLHLRLRPLVLSRRRTGKPGWRTGHEWMGVVEDVGAAVTTVKKGDRVIAPFAFSDGTCEFCLEGVQTSCLHGGYWGGKNDGGQAEAVRAATPTERSSTCPTRSKDDALIRALLPLTDVIGTGHHAAVSAGVHPRLDGRGHRRRRGRAVRRAGGETLGSRTDHRWAGTNAPRPRAPFGATDVVKERGDEGIAGSVEMTAAGPSRARMRRHRRLDGDGDRRSPGRAARSVTSACRTVAEGIDLGRMFRENIALKGGVAPVRAYIPELLADVLAGKLDPSPVFDDGRARRRSRGLRGDGRPEAIKVMVRP